MVGAATEAIVCEWYGCAGLEGEIASRDDYLSQTEFLIETIVGWPLTVVAADNNGSTHGTPRSRPG